MNAKEMKEEQLSASILASYAIDIDDYKEAGYRFTCDEFDAFCAKLCKEQREKCWENYKNNFMSDYSINELIINAPMPEL